MTRDVARPGVWLLVILGLAAVVRLQGLDGPSLWNDELFSRYYPRMGLAFLWSEGRRLEPTPPLYYSLVGAWMGLFGDGAAALRGFSVAASLPGIWLAARLGRALFGSARAGLWAALCLALSPTAVFYAQEARSYALEQTAIAAALLGLVGFLRQPGRWGGVGLFVAGALVAVYSHITASLFVVAANLVVMVSLVGPGRLPVRALLRWGVGGLVLAVLCVPLLPVVFSPAVGDALRWMEPLDTETLVYAFATLVAGPAVSGAVWPVAAACAVGLAALLVPPVRAGWRPGRLAALVTLGIPAGFVGLMILVSLRQPVLMLRTVAWLSLPLSLLLGGVLARRGMARRAGVVLLLCGGLGFQMARATDLREDWRGFLGAVVPRLAAAGPGAALVVLAPGMPATAMEAYAPAVRPLRQLQRPGPGTVETTVIPGLFGVGTIGLDTLAAAIASGRPVWLLVRQAEDDWLRAQLARLPPPPVRVQQGPGIALGW